jgi:glycosyltransferase involved in cell wall biosynthesis
MKIGIIGTRGIPNNYGGLEQFAERVSVLLVKRGYEVLVYNPDFHPYKQNSYQGVTVIHKWSPEQKIGTAGNFIYDYLCLKDAIDRKCDIVLACGYTTQSITYFIAPIHKTKLITNIDGMEWWRSKYSATIRKLAKWFEKVAIEKSLALVSDNRGIEDYVQETFGLKSYFIPYGADKNDKIDESVLQKFDLQKYKYNIMICRLEPENNIEVILDGVALSKSETKMYVAAGTNHKYAQYLIDKYKSVSKIVFLGWVSGQELLNNLRNFSALYFHGHSVGGTNPSLLEAMAGGAFIAAHGNKFNKHVLGDDALYFMNAQEVADNIDNFDTLNNKRTTFVANNISKIDTFYNWENIADMYARMFEEVASGKMTYKC